VAQDSNPHDPFEMLKRLWAPLGVPVPGLAVPTLDPEEVAKRITDLRAVEGWLQLNLNMVKMAITALEMQRSALDAMRPIPGQAGSASSAAPSGPESTMMWPWALMQQALAPGAGQTGQGDDAKSGKSGKPKK